MHPEVERLLVWLEQGSPAFLIKGDKISRRHSGGELIAEIYREGLADLEFEHCSPPVDKLVRVAAIVRKELSDGQ